MHTDADAMTEAVRDFAGPAEAAGYPRLRAWLTQLYQPSSAGSSPRTSTRRWACSPRPWPGSSRWAAFRRLDPPSGGSSPTSGCAGSSPSRRCTRANRPKHALALYAVISYMDTVGGVYFPRGGMRAAARRAGRRGAAAGVKFRYGEAVTALERSGDRVTAVRTSGGRGCRATPSC